MSGRSRTAARFATVVWALGIAGALSQIVWLLLNGADHGRLDYYYTALLVTFVASMLTIGALVVRRQPGNRIGWLFLALGGFSELWNFSQGWATYGLATSPGSLPFTTFAAWVYQWSLAVGLVMFIPIFLLFPDGKLLSPRWRVVWWLWALAAVVVSVGFALSGHDIQVGTSGHIRYVRNPTGLYGAANVIDVMGTAAGLMTFLSAVLTCVAIVLRFRRSRGETRQQMKWLAYVGVAFFVAFFVGMVLLGLTGGGSDLAGNIAFAVYGTILLLGLPAACAIAILKYRLYDLDLVIKKTVVFGLLAAFVAAVYALVVGGVGALVGSRSSTALSFVAAAVLAIGFQPARDRARRLADQLVYGKRATPYEVLTEFSERMAETFSSDDVLARMAQILAAGTGATTARVWLAVGGELRVGATWPVETAETSPMRVRGDALPAFEGEHAVEVRHQGELLGAVSVVMPPSEPMDPGKDKLVRDLAAQAGLVLRNVRLIEELRESRRRLVAAQDEERRKIERDLHDGAQQQLVALSVQLRLAEQLVGRDEQKERELLARLQASASDALEDLRDLARGIYPPLLADKGLAAALEGQARKAAVPTTVEVDGIGRYPREVESTVYFCALEALNNIAKYANASRAEVHLRHDDHHLRFDVTDDGDGFDPEVNRYGTGLQGMADRLHAIGGTLQVRSAPGEGTTVIGRVSTALANDESARGRQEPEEAAAHAASSRSGPNTAFGM
jgi:signal transduction histidine kinase